MATKIFKSYEKFKNRKDKTVNGVSEEFAAKHSNWEEMNSTNEGCWDCIDCFNCVNCEICKCCKNMPCATACTFCANGVDNAYYINCHNWDIADKRIVDLQKWW